MSEVESKWFIDIDQTRPGNSKNNHFTRLFSRTHEAIPPPQPSAFELHQTDGEILTIPCGKTVVISDGEGGSVTFAAPIENRAYINIIKRNPDGMGSCGLSTWNPAEADIKDRLGLVLSNQQDCRQIPLLAEGNEVLVAVDIVNNVLFTPSFSIWFTGQAQLVNRNQQVTEDNPIL